MSSAPGVTASDWLAAYPPPRSLTLDQEALRVYQLAYYIGEQVEVNTDPPISFTTLAAALLEGEDDTSKWFAEKAATLGPGRSAVLGSKKITDAVLAAAKQKDGPPPRSSIRLSTDKQLLTSSSRAVLENAENWAQRVGGSDIGVRHLVASYVVNPPPYHRDQLQKWGLNENLWRAEFFDWVSRRFTWEQWVDASQRVAPTAARVAFEQQEVKGGSLAWPGDEQSWSILELAANGHRSRTDPSLAFLTVFFALVTRARADDAVAKVVRPVLDAVGSSGATYSDAVTMYFAGNAREGVTPFADLDISPRVLNVLETARDLAATAGFRHRDPVVGLRVSPLHLVGAMVSRRVDADKEIEALGINLQKLRRALVDYAGAGAESIEAWRDLLGQQEAVVTGRPVDLNSDEPEAVVRLDEKWLDDPLAIRRDVEAFASLLASRDLEPPLSIGLFGPWGSGKTTFLQRLKRAVRRHADEARKDRTAAEAYVPNIVHVEFNAWHYAEGALVSSLVDATIRQIASYVADRPELGPKGWLDEKLKDLETRQRQVAAATELQNAADAAVTKAQTRLATSEDEAARRATSLRSAVSDVWRATSAALVNDDVVKGSGVLEAVGGTVQDLGELEQRMERLRARPGRMLGDLGWVRSAFFALLVLAVPPAVALIVSRFTHATDLDKLLSSVTAILAVLGVWAKAAAGAVSRVDTAATRVVAEDQRRIAGDGRVVAARTALDLARANAQTAAAGLQAAREELARAQTDAANASLPAQTLQLANTRIEDRSYAKELTTLSLARADLDALSRILRAQRTDTGAANGGLRAVDRVILYIDDLDRCQPEEVVRVLQLVHMLLAFELFVVVVAVDARWVEQALRSSYPWLSGGKSKRPGKTGEAALVESYDYVTPEDYLEKIFQIAFWLEPMTAGRAAEYLEGPRPTDGVGRYVASGAARLGAGGDQGRRLERGAGLHEGARRVRRLIASPRETPGERLPLDQGAVVRRAARRLRDRWRNRRRYAEGRTVSDCHWPARHRHRRAVVIEHDSRRARRMGSEENLRGRRREVPGPAASGLDRCRAGDRDDHADAEGDRRVRAARLGPQRRPLPAAWP